MKKICLILLAVVTVSIVAGCKKDTTAPSVVGYWTGSYNIYPASILYRADGTVRVFDGADSSTAAKAEGTYTVSDSVRAHYTYIISGESYSIATKMNDAATSMTGTWGYGPSTGGLGTILLSR